MLFLLFLMLFQGTKAMEHEKKLILNNQTIALYGYMIHSQIEDNMDHKEYTGLLNQMMNVPIEVGPEPEIIMRLKPVEEIQNPEHITYETCIFGKETVFELHEKTDYVVAENQKDGLHLYNYKTKMKIMPLGFNQ